MTFEYDLDEPPGEPEAAGSTTGRSSSRRRVTGLVLVLLGVAGLLASVALPALAQRAVRPPPGPRTGVPARWYAPTGSVPSVRDWRMTNAVLLLGDLDGHRYVVSPGGKRYARVPVDSDSDLAALSDDGRLVAWISSAGGGASRLHLLRLADGRQTSTWIQADGFRAVALRWDTGSFQVSGWRTVPRDDDSPDGQPTRDISCWLAPVVSTPQRFTSAGTQRSVNDCGGTPVQVAAFEGGDPEGRFDAVHPAGGGQEADLWLNDEWTLFVSPSFDSGVVLPRAGTTTLAAWPPGATILTARLLAWADAGILLRTVSVGEDPDARSGALLLVDPSTLRQGVLARGADDLMPLAVAPGAVGYGTAVSADPPSYPFWRPARIAELTRQVRAGHPVVEFAAFAVPVLLLGTGIALLGSRGRRSKITG
ncbi:hypothetical protein ACIB24_04390 [Spongisporangium articulatum]|uniref:WD40 repeat domain-containing protein n=1 Tax=Spongisporangium articulatum TaxID=3362603 RepID=A0ABW8AKX2_9ACTN